MDLNSPTHMYRIKLLRTSTWKHQEQVLRAVEASLALRKPQVGQRLSGDQKVVMGHIWPPGHHLETPDVINCSKSFPESRHEEER